MKRIGIDLDGTLSDMHETWLGEFNRIIRNAHPDGYPVLKQEDIREWDITKAVAPEHGKLIISLLDNPEVYSTAPVQVGAQQALRNLQEAGHEIFIVSAFYPFKKSLLPKVEWLERNFGFLDIGKSLLFASSKEMVNIDVMVDDHIGNLETFPFDKTTILYTAPWNAGRQAPGYRADNWQMVEDIIMDRYHPGHD